MIKSAWLGLLRGFVTYNEDSEFQTVVHVFIVIVAFFVITPGVVVGISNESWLYGILAGLAIPALVTVLALIGEAYSAALRKSKAVLAKEKLLADHPELKASKGAVSIPLETVRASKGALSDPNVR